MRGNAFRCSRFSWLCFDRRKQETDMRILTGAIAALALVGASGAHAQWVYVADPAPPPVVVAPLPPAVVAPAPVYVEPAMPVTVVDPRTGRRCTIEPSGYRWCWTP
jgi:hypothetical protein